MKRFKFSILRERLPFFIKFIGGHITEYDFIGILLLVLIYSLFESRVIEFISNSLSWQIEWKPIYDIVLILIWTLLIYVRIYRQAIKSFNRIDCLIIVCLLYSAIYPHWIFLKLVLVPSLKYVHFVVAYYLLHLFKTFFKLVVNTVQFNDGFFNPDYPIEFDDQDELRRNIAANHLYNSISVLKPKKAILIGIEGYWGKGKSSILNLIKEKAKAEKILHIKFLEFSPWFSKDSESLIESFFRFLEGHIGAFEQEIFEYKQAVLMTEKRIFGTSFSELFASKGAGLQDKKARINTLLALNKTTYIISIDDLDRLTKDEIISVFRLVRVIADFSSIVYLVAYDKEYVRKSISSSIPDGMSRDYFDKMFQIEYSIPEPKFNWIRDRMFNGISIQVEKFLSKQVLDRNISPVRKASILQEIQSLKNKKVLEGIIFSIRDAKRFHNNFLLRYFSIYADVDFSDFFYLELIRYASLSSYEAINNGREQILNSLAVNASYKGLSQQSSLISGEYFKSEVIGEKTHLTEVIIELLSTKDTSLYPITNRLFFHKYFALDQHESSVSDVEFNRVVFSAEEDLISTKLNEWMVMGAETEINYRLKKAKFKEPQLNLVISIIISYYKESHKVASLPSNHALSPTLQQSLYLLILKKGSKVMMFVDMLQ